MIGSLYDDELTIVTRGETGETNRLGDPVIGNVSSVVVWGRLEAAGSQEGTEYVAGRWLAYLPEGTVVTSSDIVVDSGGRRFAVEGEPEKHSLPGFPALNHVRAILTSVGG